MLALPLGNQVRQLLRVHLGGLCVADQRGRGGRWPRIDRGARETEIGEFDDVVVANQNIRALDVAMHNLALVQKVQTLEYLLQIILDLRRMHLHGAQTVQVVIEVLKHEIGAGQRFAARGRRAAAADYTEQRDQVFVTAQRLQDLDLTDGRHGKALALIFHANALQRDPPPGRIGGQIHGSGYSPARGDSSQFVSAGCMIR